MITGEIKNKIDKIWEDLWAGGISNPITVIEQLTYLMFIRQLDDKELEIESYEAMGSKNQKHIFSADENSQSMRWSKFINKDAAEIFDIVSGKVFPFIKTLNGNDNGAFSKYMKDAVFMIPSPQILEKLITGLDDLFDTDLKSMDATGDLYEYMLSKLSTSGTNGQFRTPKHIREMMVELLSPSPDDLICDPACGTAGFLIAAMHKMMNMTDDPFEKESIRKDQLFGIEDQSYMFTIATTNMILRGDGKSNLENLDFLAQNPAKLQKKGCTVGLMNPPYSQGSKQNPSLYEIAFTEHLLKSIVKGGRVAVIVPQSSMTGKTKEEQNIKSNILKKNTLEGVVTLNKNTFYGVGTNPCIVLFTAGVPHRKEKMCKFINFENDGYEVFKHVGLMPTPAAKDKKQHLLDVWRGHIKAPTKFCVFTTVEDTDEWLHSFYYFNDEIPSEEDFEKTIADYLTFEVNMITHGRGYLFGIEDIQEKNEVLKVAEDGADYV